MYLDANEKFTPPQKLEGDIVQALVDWYFRPEYIGLENVSSDKPALYVSNHTLLGLTDGPLYIPKLYNEKGVYLRPLTDKMQKDIPVWREIMSHYGLVVATRENCHKLMLQKQHILVFPGGTNEAWKNEGEEYKLIWKERYGFVKMAIEHGYPIIPIAGLGGDELYEIVLDKADIMKSFIGKWLKKTGFADKYLKGGENIPPLVRGMKGGLLPKPKRIYYKFGKPIETKQFNKNATDEAIHLLRMSVELAIYKGILEMSEFRKNKGAKTNSWIRNFLIK